ncbi:MAG: arsenate reductase (glutaredoxin) [Pseudomonadota bacterium]
MPQITLYHNPRCSKSREALALLEHRGVIPALNLYMENPPAIAELKQLLAKLGLSARELLRTSEPIYKELRLADPKLSEAQLLQAMCDDPRLIQRPIAVLGKRAIVGRPPEAILELLS